MVKSLLKITQVTSLCAETDCIKLPNHNLISAFVLPLQQYDKQRAARPEKQQHQKQQRIFL